jgi:RNA 2',3'-cyclic 3'-phosphodiesterase
VAVRPPAGTLVGVRDPHVTLCFLGEVADEQVASVAAALRSGLAGARSCPACVEAGRPRRLGPTAIVRRVTGLDELAAAVRAAVGAYAARPDDRPFRGHLTVARHRRGEPAPSEGQDPRRGNWARERAPASRTVIGAGRSPADEPGPAELQWLVDEVVLVRSQLGRGPGGTALHEVVARVPLRAAG